MIGGLAADRRLELLLAGFDEPILASLPRPDRLEQIGRMREFLRRRFGVQATGLWLTERVWQPELAADLAEAGVEYALVDDRHFLVCGFQHQELHRPHRTESDGRHVGLLAIDERLRYLIPFRPPEETAAYLRQLRAQGHGLAILADDGEKFGGWPGTKDWVYGSGWLDSFLQTMEQLTSAGEIQLSTAQDAFRQVASGGLAYLGTASYREMEKWALPPERNAIWRQLAIAERVLRQGEALAYEELDLDYDGYAELWIHSAQFSAVISPQRGGAIETFTRFSDLTNLADVLTRRRESYHEIPKQPAEGHGEGKDGGTASIHDIERASRLKELPPVDAEPRAILVDRLLGADVSAADYANARYTPIQSWAAVPLSARVSLNDDSVTGVLQGNDLEKRLRFDATGWLAVGYTWKAAAAPANAAFAPELSLAREVALRLQPDAEVWRSKITTVARSERGFEETVQGVSITPRWPARLGSGALEISS